MVINHNDPSRNIYDDYDPLKHYYKLLSMPGRYFQAREFNVLQSMLLDLIKGLGNSIYKDGNIVEGCAVNVDGTNVTISKGRIYYDGIIFDTDNTSVTIKGIGDEFIGVKVEDTIVDYDTDESLLDPAVGHASHLHPGCKRVKRELVFTLNDTLSAPIVKLRDGQIINLVVDAPVMDTMSEVLARRTFDESGNYVARGFEILDTQYSDADTILVGLSKGKAYIKGYEVQKPADTTFEVPKSKDYRLVEGEPKLASSSSNVYTLINAPVRAVKRVFVTAEHSETVNRGAVAGTQDSLTKSPVLSIVEIKQSATTYTAGVDFILTNNKIDWSPSGKEPATGTNYTVKYRYKTSLVEGTDYTVTSTDNQTKITLSTGKVVAGTEFLVDYEYYLARKDTISMDRYGEIQVSKGTPDDLLNVVAPIVTDENLLKLGSITVLPNSDKITVLNNTVRVSTMEKIQNTVRRVDELEYNMSITDLDNEAMVGESATELRGVFTDGFLNFYKADMTHDEVDFSLDSSNGTLDLPFNEFNAPMSIGTFPQNKYATLGNVYCCPYTEVVAFNQPFSTQTMLVNPYQVFDPMMGVSIDPQVDNWIETSTITVENVNVTTAHLRKWWAHPDAAWAQQEKALWEAMGFVDGDGATGMDYSMHQGKLNNYLAYNSNQHITGTATETILDEAIAYMRQTTIKIYSKTFPYGEDNIKCKFDGRVVELTPIGTTSVGTQAGSVRADSKGVVEASFVVPENVPCGTKEVELYSPNFSGKTTYTANGRKTVVQETIYIQRNEVWATDPLAQTFQLSETCNITSVDVYFAVKDGNVPVKIQLRGTTNGYPNTTVYGECVLTGSEINVSDDASIPTRARFSNVVKCEKDTQYCIVVMTDSPTIALHVAKLGERDTLVGSYLTSNPYTAGVLFSSSNAITWTAHQDMDMKFSLYRADYEQEGFIQFNSVSPSNADRFMLALEHIRPADTEISFEVSLNNSDWIPCYPWMDRDIDFNCYKADFRITMKSNGLQSPLISKDTARLMSWANKNKATYISRTINITDGYNDIKVYFDSRIVAGATYKVYYTTDSTASSWVELTSPSVTALNEYWQQNYYHLKLDSSHKVYRVKVVIESTAPYYRPKIKRFMNILKTI